MILASGLSRIFTTDVWMYAELLFAWIARNIMQITKAAEVMNHSA